MNHQTHDTRRRVLATRSCLYIQESLLYKTTLTRDHLAYKTTQKMSILHYNEPALLDHLCLSKEAVFVTRDYCRYTLMV